MCILPSTYREKDRNNERCTRLSFVIRDATCHVPNPNSYLTSIFFHDPVLTTSFVILNPLAHPPPVHTTLICLRSFPKISKRQKKSKNKTGVELTHHPLLTRPPLDPESPVRRAISPPGVHAFFLFVSSFIRPHSSFPQRKELNHGPVASRKRILAFALAISSIFEPQDRGMLSSYQKCKSQAYSNSKDSKKIKKSAPLPREQKIKKKSQGSSAPLLLHHDNAPSSSFRRVFDLAFSSGIRSLAGTRAVFVCCGW